MRFLIWLLLAGFPAHAAPCTDSARPFWSVACTDPRLQAITEEMDNLIAEIRDSPALHPGTWAAHGLRSEMIYQQLNDCLGANNASACMLPIAAGYAAELRGNPVLRPDRQGLARAPVDLLCPAFAQPFRLTRFDTDPALVWMSPGFVLLERDTGARNVVYGGQTVNGSVDLGITPAGTVVLTGFGDRPMPCSVLDDSVLR